MSMPKARTATLLIVALLGLWSAPALAQQGDVIPTPVQQFGDSNMDPLSGGKLCAYAAGTSTPLDTYTDKDLTVAHANPIILNTAGRPATSGGTVSPIFLSSRGYKFVLRTAGSDTTCVHPDFFDLLIAHPPCTDVAVSGARYFAAKGPKRQLDAIMFARALLAAPIPRIALENPVSILSSVIAKPEQVIQPWMFGHGEVKATCLWLKNLPKLVPTDIVDGRTPRVHHASPGPDRWKERSRTLQGIADAMADQWGSLA